MTTNTPPIDADHANSRRVTSEQNGPHPNLLSHIERHRQHGFEKPVADHSRQAFEGAAKTVRNRGQSLILDSGCGTGDSTRNLAALYPDHLVIGVDKSAHRLTRQDREPLNENALLLRADLIDFYRLAHEAGWRLARHFILYPNPWPKPGHLMRRWHGSPVFPSIVALGGQIELRTNWQIYAEEFQLALQQFGIEAITEPFGPDEKDYLTLFERKYHLSGQTLYKLTAFAAD